MKFTDKATKLSQAENLLVKAVDLIDQATYGTAAWAMAKDYTIPMLENIAGIGGDPNAKGSITNLMTLAEEGGEGEESSATEEDIEDYEDNELAEYDDEEYDDEELVDDDFSDLDEDGLDPDDDWEDEE